MSFEVLKRLRRVAPALPRWSPPLRQQQHYFVSRYFTETLERRTLLSVSPLQAHPATVDATNRVVCSVFDPHLNRTVQAAFGPYQGIGYLTTDGGIVTWDEGSSPTFRIHAAAYDPQREQWISTSFGDVNQIVQTLNQSGIVVWADLSSGTDAAGLATYDPQRGWVTTSINTPSFYYRSYPSTDGNVVVWQAMPNSPSQSPTQVYAVAYDPLPGHSWSLYEANGSGISLGNSSVTYTYNGSVQTLGFSYSSGWHGGPTTAQAYFVAQPTSGDPPLWVWYTDISIGGTSWSYTYGDGNSSSARSGYHIYSGYGAYTLTESISGPGGPSSKSIPILTDSVPPTGSVSINGGAAITSSPAVTLTLSANDNSGTVASMRFSNDGSSWSSWQPYATTAAWSLSSGEGNKTVYAEFQDPAGSISSPATASILFDTSVRWVNPVSGNWNDPSMWSNHAVPTPSDKVVIDVQGSYAVTLSDTAANVTSLAIGGGASLSIIDAQSGLSTSSISLTGIGTLSIAGGDVTATSLSLPDWSRLNFTAGTLNLTGNSSNPGTLIVGRGSGSARLSQNGGNVSADSLELGEDVGSSGTYVMGNGSLNVQQKEYVGFNGSGEFDQNGGSNTTGYLYLGGVNVGVPGSGTYNLSSGTVTVLTTEEVGLTGPGIFNQPGGTHVAAELSLGAFAATGTYVLSNDAQLTVQGGLTVGGSEGGGVGVFNQNGGSASVGSLILAYATNARGSYVLSAGTLAVQTYEAIGFGGVALFNQTGGVQTISSTGSGDRGLYVGYQSTGSGRFDLGGGSLDVAVSELVGYHGSGTLDQTAGSNAVGKNLLVGVGDRGTSASGTYDLRGGTLNVQMTEEIGYTSPGLIDQTGGEHTALEIELGAYSVTGTYKLSAGGSLTVHGGLTVGGSEGGGVGIFDQMGGASSIGQVILGYNPGVSGTYTLSGGSLEVHSYEAIGFTGTGMFTQSGGVQTIDSIGTGDLGLFIGYQAGSHGIYVLSGGRFDDHGPDRIGRQGSGSFSQSGGTQTTSGPVTIAGNSGSDGTLAFSGVGAVFTTLGDVTVGIPSPPDPSAQSTAALRVVGGGATIDIGGNLVMGATMPSLLEVVDSSGLSLIYATGASLAGNLDVQLSGVSPSHGQSFTVIATQSGVAGSAQLAGPDASEFMTAVTATSLSLVFSGQPGDTNNDGVVGFDDLLNVAQHYGQPGNLSDGDVNHDGTVDFADLLIVAQNYGKGVALAGDGLKLNATVEATANSAPTLSRNSPADANVTATVGQTVTFKANGADVDGNLSGTEWYGAGDNPYEQYVGSTGGTGHAATFSRTHTFTTPGIYGITVLAFDTLSAYSAGVTWTVTVVPPAAKTRTQSSIVVAVGQSVSFGDSVSDNNGTLAGATWTGDGDDFAQLVADVGGNASAATFAHAHVFAAPGTYAISVKPFESGGALTAETDWSVTVVPPMRGLYVDGFDTIVGDAAREDALLRYAADQGITYLALYRLQNVWNRADAIAAFISRAKASFGIQQLGAIGASNDFFDQAVAFNDAHAAKFDVLNLEYEYWNDTPRDFSVYLSLLDHMHQVAAPRGLLVEAYVGWPTTDEMPQIVSRVDRLFVHAYVQDPSTSFSYTRDRLLAAAPADHSVQVWPIFSSETDFSGPWFDTHSLVAAEQTYRAAYDADPSPSKYGAAITGFQYFDYGQITGSIAGSVYGDSNNNGTRDTQEAGLAGVTVFLDENNDGILNPDETTATTDSQGNYLFTGLAPGKYILRQVVPSGYAGTSPSDYAGTASASTGESTAPGPIFGDVQIATVSMDFAYLLTVAQHYNQPGTFATGDVNGDGSVSFADLLILAQNYGHALPAAATSADSASLLPGKRGRRR